MDQLLCTMSNVLHVMRGVACLQSMSAFLLLGKVYSKMFLQALSLKPFPGGSPIEILTDQNTPDEDQDVQEPQCNRGNAPVTPVTELLEKDLSKVVSSIQSCSHGINKVVESLQQSFPGVPKTQLRNKVREVSEFVDNRWKVKKTVLDKLGFTISPEKSVERTRGIAAFFSKRCLPPADGSLKTDETSPQQNRKPEMRCNDERCTVNRKPEMHNEEMHTVVDLL